MTEQAGARQQQVEPEKQGGHRSAAGSPWSNLDAYVAMPRLGDLVLSADGSTLLVAVTAPDPDVTAYTTAWWRIDVAGSTPARRVTRSVEGESAAAFTPDGSLLFTSKRPVPPVKEEADEADHEMEVLWCLPAGGGEAYALARRPGGWSAVTTARLSTTTLLTCDAQVSSADESQHADICEQRRKRKVTAVLHEGYPVRYWDHDLGATDVRVLGVELTAGETGDLDPAPEDLRLLTPGRGCPLGTVRGLSDDGAVAVLDWSEADPGGVRRGTVVVGQPATGKTWTAARDEVDEFSEGVVAPDGSFLVCVRETTSTATTCPDQTLWRVDLTHDLVTGDSPTPDLPATDEGQPVAADWDAWPKPRAVSPDGRTLIASVDERGHGPLYTVDLATGSRRRLTGDGTVGAAVLSPDGTTVYAVCSSYLDPGSLLAIDVATGATRELVSPVSYPPLPGQLADVTAVASDGTEIRSYLALPADASPEHPAPLALWAHGGPLSSWNAWSWRWCPWLLVAQGYAVLLPDPALSTGYGRAFIQRGWGRWGGEPYTDLMAATDAVAARLDIDDTRSVMMGGSFGGYLANWIAGHTDRFAAIVSHASLWNLESFGPTTDAAWYWAREMSPDMMRAYSPHHFAEQVRTPMLVVHGDKDYRVPISEGLSLWWSLVSHFGGPPQELPHRFLYFPEENHWILTPQHAKVWYETIVAFLNAHVDGGNFCRPTAL